ncbi:MAG: cob(I)yrinic acid a,c-diamide adenosyltransferase [Bacillota bacterium]|nr:cob(I)yrinic acid a,c-diamide adenosyltransferase [Bacillota bacterium]
MPEEGAARGLIIVYTGDGKGKTTAAFGLALRALGRGRRVKVIQFLKGRPSGEVLAAQRWLPLLSVEQAGGESLVDPRALSPEDRQRAAAGWSSACAAVSSGQWDVVVLDELNVAVNFGLIPLAEVLEMVRRKPSAVDLVLTGRGAPPELIQLADLVTEMREVKHPFRKGVPARTGIDL